MQTVGVQKVTARRRGSAMPELPPTSWGLLDAACGKDADADAALAEFSRRYYAPVRAYVAALTGEDDADDLTQSFFTSRILSKNVLAAALPSRGSFRPYLKRAIRNFLIDAVRREHRVKRGGAVRPVQYDTVAGAVDGRTWSRPDAAFHETWVRAILEDALSRVRKLCAERGQLDHFELFLHRHLSSSSPLPSWEELGARFQLGEKTARSRAETVARHFRSVLRQMLAIELGSRRAVNEELATLHVLLKEGS